MNSTRNSKSTKLKNPRGDGYAEPLFGRFPDKLPHCKIFVDMIREQGFENLMTFQHVPSENRMQVDGSMSAPGFMAEMLLQSHLGEIHLLPALPSQWHKGSVKGLIARGGYRIDLEWDKGQLTRAHIKASRDLVPRIRVQGELIDPAKDPRVIF